MNTNTGNMPLLKIGNLIANVPIIQGGMGVGISLSSLASAVANAGGIGVLSTAGMGLDFQSYKNNPSETSVNVLKEEIRKTKTLTRGIFGVNIMVALTNFEEMVKASIDEGIDMIFAGAGLPLDLPKYVASGSRTKLIPIVSSAKAAGIIMKRWATRYDYLPDAIVVEGPLAGGHLGFKPEQLADSEFSLDKLLLTVLDEVKIYEEAYGKSIPVIAAGGIYSGEDIQRLIAMGAAGVQMGTRFVATHECDASAEFKTAYLNCKEEDIFIINSPVGMPGRAIMNSFLEDVQKGLTSPYNCPYQCIKTCKYTESPYCIAIALLNAKNGNLKSGFAFAGQNAYRINKIVHVQELIDCLKEEYCLAAQNYPCNAQMA